MAHEIESLLNACLEIEGLLTLIQRRKESTPQSVFMLLDEKVASFAAEVSKIKCEDMENSATDEIASEDESECSFVAEESDSEIESTEPEIEGDEACVEPSDYEPCECEDENEVEDETGSVFVDNVVDEDNIVVADNSELDESIPEMDETSSESCDDDTDVEQVDSEQVELVTPEPSLFDDDTDVSDDEDSEDNEPEAPHRQLIFTINDRYRFRRELFGNSDAEMADALNVLNAMSTVDEVEDYFYNDLCWDPENEDVKDFIKLATESFRFR